MYKRNLEYKLRESLDDSPVVLINGARQTGKSTLVQNALGKTHTYYTLDDLSILSILKSDPYSFLKAQKTPIILDEVQRAPEAFLPLKRIVDEDRVPGKFVLTGSANVLMLPKLSDSLAGRMEVLTLWPLSSYETRGNSMDFISALFSGEFLNIKKKTVEVEDLRACILKGGYPEAVRRATTSRRNNWFKGYLQTILTRDVQDIAGIERVGQLPTLLNILATRVGGLLNVSELSRTSQIPLTTLNRYLKIFEMIYLTVTLQPWHANLGKRYVKSPKLYLSDVGLVSYLLGMNEEHVINRPDIWGHLLENYIIMEFYKCQSWTESSFNLYHYRTDRNEEIDLIVENARGDLLAVEIKSGSNIQGKSLKAIKHLQTELPNKLVRGIVIYCGDKVQVLGENIWALPILYFI